MNFVQLNSSQLNSTQLNSAPSLPFPIMNQNIFTALAKRDAATVETLINGAPLHIRYVYMNFAISWCLVDMVKILHTKCHIPLTASDGDLGMAVPDPAMADTLLEFNCPFTSLALIHAAKKSDQYACFYTLLGRGVPLTRKVVCFLLRTGRLRLLHLLHSQDKLQTAEMVDPKYAHAAAKARTADCLTWVINTFNTQPTQTTLHSAMKRGRIGNVRWLLEHHYGVLDSTMISAAAGFRDLKYVQWLQKMNCPVSVWNWRTVRAFQNEPVTEYMKQHNFPTQCSCSSISGCSCEGLFHSYLRTYLGESSDVQ